MLVCMYKVMLMSPAHAIAFVDMRKLGSEGTTKSTVTAYPRQLESLIRLSEAHAKMRSLI